MPIRKGPYLDFERQNIMAIGEITTNKPVQPPLKSPSTKASETNRPVENEKNDRSWGNMAGATKVNFAKPITNTLDQAIGRNLNVQG
jgi:hypothetical protein